jgi:UDP-glucose 4-epimerase
LANSSDEVVNRIELLSGTKPAFYSLDITNEAALDKVFDEHPDIDNVIHFAALKVSLYVCVFSPSLENIEMVSMIAWRQISNFNESQT